ncbi:P-loop containing nucleoside triphosphate hydrolase protein [Gorgonomyces haynaldii]|nr:P-loop containing nucleoside triphosphate hydrolase protein [Gorgonomyces haynaldii]
MKSITHENDLEQFLTTATLAGLDFAAERLHVSVVDNTKNPFLLTEEEMEETKEQFRAHQDLLTIPKRPQWDTTTTPEQLQMREQHSFLEWRRGLVDLEERKGLLMTPYERNLEIWRQLWRVIERSELVVQIVDARNPLFFRCPDLESYVKQVSPEKENVLLVNKADLLTTQQRMLWADFFTQNGIQYIFFSAAMAKQTLEDEEFLESNPDAQIERISQEGIPEKARILDALELLQFLQDICPSSERSRSTGKNTIGFVGYPNVGKSSTMNALVGAKKVAVGSTPGKTKHFQTIHISDTMILCDCPGLVFPSFATTKAEMVVNGVLPIDELREVQGPSGLVVQRIPKHYLEAIYGISIKTRNVEGELVSRQPTASEFLQAYAIARGYTKSSQGNPDESRAARYILKDYVNGKLLYVEPPPELDPTEFNRELYENEDLLSRSIKKVNLDLLKEKQRTETVETDTVLKLIVEASAFKCQASGQGVL